MAAHDSEVASHKAWLGLLQPVGLVVSPPALVKAQAVPSRNVVELQQTLLSVVRQPPRTAFADEADPYLDDLPRFADRVLGWAPEDLAGAPGGPSLADDLELALPDYGDTLRPDLAVIDSMGDGKLLMLVQDLPLDTPFDDPPPKDRHGGRWHASPQARLERLMREKDVPAGLLSNGRELRLVHAPRGESSGHLTFPVPAMCEVAGRPILAALHMLLSEYRVFSAPDGRRLLDLLTESRKYQAEVSNALSEQVLGALWELMHGFQAADEAADHRLLGRIAREDPQHLYGGLLTVLLRLVFLLYAEDEGLMPADGVYARNYSVTGLYDRLRTDAGRYPDTMDQRYGAWSWLVSLFRLVFDGGGHGGLRLPTRHGQLFNPDEYPFLEGRPYGVARQRGEQFEAPRVSDGTVHRVLDALLVLDGERLPYRALDVEQIGSVYEAMMGFAVERACGHAIAVRPKHVVVDVDLLLEQAPGKRKKWLKDTAECDVTGKPLTALKEAETTEDVVAALGRKVSPRTPRLLGPGALYLQPGEERRRSGSHYTPRELTEPIVRTTLRPVLEALGERPTPEQILDLKVCDPAMGSGAFLVEACRQLAEQLVKAWEVHDCLPDFPPDEEPLLHARRLVVQRCLYGVDKNPFAVNLAKLSLWLVTLARDHAFTFLDHVLKHGDSLVGLTRAQIGAFHWKPVKPDNDDLPLLRHVSESIDRAAGHRRELQQLGEGEYLEKKDVWEQAEYALRDARLVGDLVIAAYFGADKDKVREELRLDYRGMIRAWRAGEKDTTELQGLVDDLRSGDEPVAPLHWEIEFPEVFERNEPGFDCVVGNPPFAGKNTVIASNRVGFSDWLKSLHQGAHGNADLVAHFFRRAFTLLRQYGTLGLVATNTIAQGDTRATGLRWMCTNGGTIYEARRRVKWPGAAAVIVSVVHVRKGEVQRGRLLDGHDVPVITAFLFHAGGHNDPAPLFANAGKSFIGSYVLGMGFTFDDTNPEATPIAEMHRLNEKDPCNAERVFPYIGGQEVNSSPTHDHRRYVINFGEMTEEEARRWPDLLAIVEEKVKPARLAQKREIRARYWWRFAESTPALFRAINGLERVLVWARHQPQWSTAFMPAEMVFSEALVIVSSSRFSFFALLQCRVHELWARFFGSSLKDDLRYTPSDCFETFPFPDGWESAPNLEVVGTEYYTFRAERMVRSEEGLTSTYNRFHDPEERATDILKLRDLHAAMDRAVLDAYGWEDIPTDCEFLLDYEIDEETWGNKKKPYRYRWPGEVRDEVLARLLDLNQKRYREEVAAGLHDGRGGKKKASRKAGKKKAKAGPTAQTGFAFGTPSGTGEDA